MEPDQRGLTRRALARRSEPFGGVPYARPDHPLGWAPIEFEPRLPLDEATWTRDDELADLTDEAFRLRVDMERALWRGEGREAHPDLVDHRRAVRALVDGWDHVPERPTVVEPTDEPTVLLVAARALAEVVEEADADGRLAVLARVGEVRRELGWAGADALGRDVVDQYALAMVHTELVRECAANRRDRGREEGDRPGAPSVAPEVEALARFGTALGVWTESTTADDADRDEKAWDRRLRRAEAGLRNAARLVRHARKAGWIPDAPLVGEQIGLDETVAVDPLAPLTAPLMSPSVGSDSADLDDADGDGPADDDPVDQPLPPPPPTWIRRSVLESPSCALERDWYYEWPQVARIFEEGPGWLRDVTPPDLGPDDAWMRLDWVVWKADMSWLAFIRMR